MRALTASSSAGLVGPKFEPVEAAALLGMGDVAEILPQKYLGSAKDCPISDEPRTMPRSVTRLPDACRPKNSCATPVTANGYAMPVNAVRTVKMTSKGRRIWPTYLSC